MGKRFHACDLNQPFLLSPVMQDWLPANHLARFIAEVCEQLDLSAMLKRYERRDGRGKTAYHPVMLTRLLLYSYAIGVRSSRQIERATYQDLAFRYLAANQQPDHDTIAAFRKEQMEELSRLFAQVLQLCREARLLRVGVLAVDGTKIQANASRAQSVTYAELQVSEQELRERMKQLLLEAEQVDQAEAGTTTVEALPEEYRDAAARLEKIQQAKAALETRAKAEAAKVKQEVEAARNAGKRPDGALRKRLYRHRSELPKARAQGNLTDPDSQLMKAGNSGGFVQGYNAQVAVAAESQIIVAALVSQNPDDRNHLLPVLQAVREQRVEPTQLVADAGYWNTEALQDSAIGAVDVLVPPDASRRQYPQAALPANAPKTEVAWKMRERLATAEGRRLYQQRQAVVEPVFGRIKEARGIRRFLLRGLASVHAEWLMICMTHNLLKLYKSTLHPHTGPVTSSSAVRQHLDSRLAFATVDPQSIASRSPAILTPSRRKCSHGRLSRFRNCRFSSR
ncbi:MAG: IS1182 family transposase, partial [Acidobacteria bacterium]|nr:IS1182 family transposase [Acidobacteriota bacterium]